MKEFFLKLLCRLHIQCQWVNAYCPFDDGNDCYRHQECRICHDERCLDELDVDFLL